MDADPGVRIQYAAKYAQTANYWKYYIGQSKGLKALDVYGKKESTRRRVCCLDDSIAEREKRVRRGHSACSRPTTRTPTPPSKARSTHSKLASSVVI